MMRSSFALLSCVLASSLVACEYHVVSGDDDGTNAHRTSPPRDETPAAPDAPASCRPTIARDKELLVIDRSVLLSPSARSDVDDAPLGFRGLMELLAGSADAAPRAAEAWLRQWLAVTSVGPDYAPVTPRPAMEEILYGPWRAASGGGALSLSKAPFRLIAIVNRPDLRARGDGCGGSAGELRLVYSAYDLPTRISLPFTVSFEIPYPATRSPQGWAQAWHDLAALPFGDAYTAGLAELVGGATRASSPASWRVRTNEIALGEAAHLPWELREFALSTSSSGDVPRQLVQIPIASTPRIELDGSASLEAWAKENAPRILDGSYILPSSFQAGAAPVERAFFRWRSPRMAPDVRQALSMGTCNGCHGGERSDERTLPFQHLAAADQKLATVYYGTSPGGETRVSSWLEEKELPRREESARRLLCSPCNGGLPDSPERYGETARTAAMNAATASRSFTPGACSTPLATSTQ